MTLTASRRAVINRDIGNGEDHMAKRRAVALELRDTLDPLCRVFRERVESEVTIDTLHDILKRYRIYMEPTGFSKLGMFNAITRLDLGSFKGDYRAYGLNPAFEERAPYGGHYGDQIGKDLVATEILLAHSCSQLIGDMIGSIARQHALLIKPLDLGSSKSKVSLSYIFIDGIRSVGNSFSLLTAEGVPGVSSHMEALETLARQGFPNKLSLMMPFGMLGDLMSTGHYMHGPIESEEGGELKLSKRFRDDVASVDGKYFRHYEHLSNAVGVGCPVGRKASGKARTGVQEVTDAFMHVLRIIDEYGFTDWFPE